MSRMHHTYADYLALDEASSIRHEYLNGEIYAMAGGSPDHAALAAATITALGARLPPGCRIFCSDLRVRVQATGLATYPDVTVVCGATQRAADDPLAVVNPLVVVEVTSPSTEEYDRGEKLRHYQSIPSLREIVIVSHREPRLTLLRRSETDWSEVTAGPGESVTLDALATRIATDDVYRGGLEDRR